MNRQLNGFTATQTQEGFHVISHDSTKEFEITSVIEEIIKEEANAVKEIKKKPETINFLVGQVMKKTQGKADPTLVRDSLKKKLSHL